MNTQNKKKFPHDKAKLLGLIFLVSAFALLVKQVSRYSVFTVDDAFITWRYGLNFVESGFWNYNPSLFELSEAYTNPIIAFLSIIPAFLSLDIVLFFKLLALAVHIGYLFRLYSILGPVYFIPAALMLVTPSFVLHNYSGLETTFFGLLVFELFYQTYRQQAFGILLSSLILVFIRPEGILFSVCALIYAAILKNKRLVLYSFFPLCAFFLYLIFRISYFGIPLPNTYYIKSGANFSFDRFQSYFFYIFPLVALLFVNRGKQKWLSAAFLVSLIVIAYTYSKSTLMMDYLDRFSWHLIVPATLIGLYVLSEKEKNEKEKEKLFTYCLVLVLVAFSFYFYLRDTLKNRAQIQHTVSYYPRAINSHAALGKVIAEIQNEDLIFVFGDAGITAFKSKKNAIDHIGLANRTVAQGGFTVKYLQTVKPDIVVFHSAPENMLRLNWSGQNVMMQYVQSNGLTYVCDIYWTQGYVLSVYVTHKIEGKDIKNLLSACDYSKAANNVSNFIFNQSLSDYAFYKYWSINVRDTNVVRNIFTDATQASWIYGSDFQVRLKNNKIYFYKENCEIGDVQARFFLHFFPTDGGQLTNNEKKNGFKNLDFNFSQNGAMSNGSCVAVQELPGEAASLRFGQFIPGQGRVWEGTYRPGN